MSIYSSPTFEYPEDQLFETNARRRFVVEAIGATFALILMTTLPGNTITDVVDTYDSPVIAIATADQAYELATRLDYSVQADAE